jgi:hypothetical protein
MIFVHAMLSQASLTSDQVEATKTKLNKLSPAQIPGQDIMKYATLVQEYKLELSIPTIMHSPKMS